MTEDSLLSSNPKTNRIAHPVSRFIRRPIWLAGVVLLITGVTVSHADESAIAHGKSTVTWTDDAVDMVLIADADGNVCLQDFGRLLAEGEMGDQPKLNQLLPDVTVNVNRFSTRALIAAANLGLQGHGTLTIESDGAGGSQVRLKCDMSFLRTNRATFEPTLDLDAVAIDAISDSSTTNTVLFIHGFRGTPESFDGLRNHLRQTGVRTGAIRYDDHLPVAESAAAIAEMVASSGSAMPRGGIVIVGHSMGGLVGREWAENPSLPHSNVVGLITVGTPHQGSTWAEVTPLPDVLANGRVTGDALLAWMSKRSTAASAVDLRPGSAFLTSLALRPRNPKIRYTTIIGTASPIDAESMERMRQRVANPAPAVVGGAVQQRTAALVEQLDRTCGGKGDGVVAIDDAKIPGVDDIVMVERTHWEFFDPTHGGDINPVWAAIAERVRTGQSSN